MADNNADSPVSTNNNTESMQSPLVNGQNSVPDEQPLTENTEDKESSSHERTQTDHLNSILLRSFLEKLNQPNSGFPQTVKFDTEENNEEDGFCN
ncbi:hypothetical protein LSH36_58g11032 [Paralvinella palmiformis]|uniref:Uncharacterized protein n=1 Tax=Paralvinella palmiformis TaxID=53620 RepID=A0AAD9K4M4_9ANNE|nr:hypothetical protein LSH36_58g11032 [Paralvinella palmiformis]